MNEGSRRPHRLALGVGFLAATLAASASAQTPVIRPGREAEITALFEPHALGGEIVDGWVLDSIDVDRSTILVVLRATSGEETARLTLHHPDHGPGTSSTSPSFAIAERGGPRSAEARAALLRALRVNDDGTFWQTDPAFETPRPDGIAGWALPFAVRSSPLAPVSIALLALVGAGLGAFRFRRRGEARPSSDQVKRARR